MKKVMIPLILILVFCLPWTASAKEWELGLGYTPMLDEEAQDTSFQESSLLSFHLGYSFWWLFYASWDSFILPPFIVESMTGAFEEDPNDPEAGFYREGYYRPGFLNMFDVGIRLSLGPVIGFAEMGINTLYVYRQKEDELEIDSGVGANIRLGVGARFDWWGLTLAISSIQPSLDQTFELIRNLTSDDAFTQDKAKEMFADTLVPSLMFVMYF